MKKYAYLVILILIHFCAFSQEAQEEGVDLLKAPASPASQLLNIAPNTIERPTDLSSLWISVNNTTEGLSKFPTNYALDLSPASLFGSKGLTLTDLKSQFIGKVMWQSLMISTGIKQEEDTLTGNPFYKTAIGFKFSFFRGHWSDKTTTRYNEILAMQRQVTGKIEVSLEEVLDDTAYTSMVAKKELILESDVVAHEKLDKEIEDLFHRLMLEKRVTRIANNPAFHA